MTELTRDIASGAGSGVGELPIRADWVLRRGGGLKETGATTECLRQSGNKLLLHWSV